MPNTMPTKPEQTVSQQVADPGKAPLDEDALLFRLSFHHKRRVFWLLGGMAVILLGLYIALVAVLFLGHNGRLVQLIHDVPLALVPITSALVAAAFLAASLAHYIFLDGKGKEDGTREESSMRAVQIIREVVAPLMEAIKALAGKQ